MSGPPTIDECVAHGAHRLAKAGIANPRREARLILAYALGLDTAIVRGYPERRVEDTRSYQTLIDRRAGREPLSHLTGWREFWSIDFEVTPATLDPRPDSETIVEAALGVITGRDAEVSILDFGTGTGCLLIAMLSERPRATGVGIDVSEGAIAVARRNADRHGLSNRAMFVVGSWGAALSGPFDLIVANPPYIASGEMNHLQPEVAGYEPRTALDGGADGLRAYRALGQDILRLLAPDGFALLEIGAGQGANVAEILAAAGLAIAGFSSDLAGRARCIICRKR